MPSSTSAKPVRYRALDGYRFVAACGVVVYHFNLDFRLGLENISPAIAQLSTMVDFFFLLSGFVIAVSYAGRMTSVTDYIRFLRARLARIYPLHLLTNVVLLGFLAISLIWQLPINHPDIFAFSGLPANLLLIHAWGVLDHPSFNVPSWSISAEWLMYLLTPMLFFAARRVNVFLNLITVITFVFLMIGERQSAGLGIWTNATYDFGAFRALPTFFAGVLIATNLHRLPVTMAPPWWMVHLTFAVALLSLHFSVAREIALMLFALLVIAAALAERNRRPGFMSGKLMTGLGDASYSVYMLHVIVSIPFLFLARKLAMIGAPGAMYFALGAGTVTIALSLFVHAWFEVPMRLWLTGGKLPDNSRSQPLSTPNKPLPG